MFGFQEIPGLLTPEMNSNVRQSSMLHAAAGLLNASGWSDKPTSIFQALGQGLQGGLQGYEQGQNQAVRQFLLREQAQKLIEARKQAEQWAAIFGGPVPAAAPAADMAVPAGPAPMRVASTSPILPAGALRTDGTQILGGAMPTAPARGAVPPSAKVWGDAEAEAAGLYEPAKKAIPTQRDVRATANDGLRATIAAMPQGVREMIAIAGPEKGKEILAQWVGKKAEKPSDTFLTVEMPDGATKPYRADSPDLDRAIAAGGLIVTTPSSKGQNELVALRMTDGNIKTFRRADPVVDELISGGAVEVSKPSSDPKEHKPDNYALPDGRTVLSEDGKSYVDPKTKQRATMPPDAVRLGAESGYEASRANAVRGRAQTELDNSAGATERPPAESPAKKGTGTWSNVMAAYNAVAGGVGLDKAFGKNGMFAENEANRNYLLNIRQVAKTALVNNPRFPVAEQKNVDAMFPDPRTFWANPRTEADKIPLLRNTLEEQLRANNEALAQGGLAKEEVSRLTSNNIETRRALRLLGHGDSSLKGLGDTIGAAPVAEKPKADAPPTPEARKGYDGKWYVPDPKRPGKYMRVVAD